MMYVEKFTLKKHPVYIVDLYSFSLKFIYVDKICRFHFFSGTYSISMFTFLDLFNTSIFKIVFSANSIKIHI